MAKTKTELRSNRDGNGEVDGDDRNDRLHSSENRLLNDGWLQWFHEKKARSADGMQLMFWLEKSKSTRRW